ncbi:hypothetical protein DQ04_04541010 [Trypanosoma grayi]|uniref:hypothetical protein n=1 Tax=Trypanosoma grayi TaxID=71804 RepID=UPI0004F44A13|nr:hypothetical protein DQ04_04541010 [Trypanosoma grayi]KEG09844.1 hypothetical protein DQ04_04541010 [Trypanosoma grayi]
MLSIACRVKVFVATHTNGSTASAFPSAGVNEVSVSFAATASGGGGGAATADTVGQPCCNADVGGINSQAQSSAHEGGARTPSSVLSGANAHNSHDGTDENFFDSDNEDEADDDKNDPLVRFLALPLTLRVMMGVNWLSVISNCLTYYLRPSQVLYAFLLCSCDMMLYVVDDQLGSRRVHHKASTLRGVNGITTVCVSADSPVFRVEEENARPSAAAHGSADGPRGPRRGCDVTLAGESDSVESDGRVLSSVRGCAKAEPNWRRLEGCISKRSKYLFWNHSRVFSQRGAVLVMLNIALVFALVLFHLNHLFFLAGTIIGYLACCGTLFVLGCSIGVLLLLFGWVRSRGAAGSPLLKANSVCSLDPASLPPSGVLPNRWLRVCYVLQQIFSLACSVLYFSMLLEEGEELYSSHMEFMRWYVNTVGQGLVDTVRLFIFWHLVRLCSRREGKIWHHQIYGVGESLL